MILACNSTDVNLKKGFIPINVEVGRNGLGTVVVLFDLIIMSCFLVFVWYASYYVRIDANRFKSLNIEI
jgi:hypothetical protein